MEVRCGLLYVHVYNTWHRILFQSQWFLLLHIRYRVYIYSVARARAIDADSCRGMSDLPPLKGGSISYKNQECKYTHKCIVRDHNHNILVDYNIPAFNKSHFQNAMRLQSRCSIMYFDATDFSVTWSTTTVQYIFACSRRHGVEQRNDERKES
jgi:hypothetical protein